MEKIKLFIKFDMIKGAISLPYKKPLSLEQAKAQLENPRQTVDHEGVRSIYKKCLEDTVKMHESGEEFKTHEDISQVLYTFNNAVLVPFPFEMFSVSSMSVRSATLVPLK